MQKLGILASVFLWELIKYLHGGHLMDMAGYNKFKETMLKGVKLNKEAKVGIRLNWVEQEYKANMNVKKVNN